MAQVLAGAAVGAAHQARVERDHVHEVAEAQRLAQELPGDARLQERLAGIEEQLARAYAESLRTLLGHASDVLRSVASYHIAELGLDALRDDLAAASRRGGILQPLTDRALSLLESSRRPELRSAH